MILPIELGIDLAAGEKVYVLPETFATHYHLVGATGTGKTTAIRAILHPIMAEPRQKACVFVIDPMGNLTRDLLRWMVSRQCPNHVRRRLLLIEPSREEFVIPFNPLHFTTAANMYYQVARSVDLIQRAWKAQDLGQQPRLMQWSYKAMCAVAAMGFPIAMSRYLLHPGTDEHRAILSRIPSEIRYHWVEILEARASEAIRCLESTRNRFDPFYESVILRRMFGSTTSRFDAERFIRERRIVIINLARLGKLPTQLAHTIGALMVNEVLETAYNMSATRGPSSVFPTYLCLDEFQNYVSPDVEDALPTVRQMGIRFILAHQSFSQLEQGDIDLSNMIWQARSKLFFANMAEDADIVANELATLTFDPMKVKDMRKSLKQLIVGYRKEWLESEGVTNNVGDSTINQRSVGYQRGEGRSHVLGELPLTISHRDGRSDGTTTGGSHTTSSGSSLSRSQANVPIHEFMEEISNITYVPFEEHRLEWQRIIRELQTGIAFALFVNDPRLYKVQIRHDEITATKAREAAVDELIARNFEQDVFISAAEADRLGEEDRRKLLAPPTIIIPGSVSQPGIPLADPASNSPTQVPDESQPFRKRKRKS